jgi:hypothetical protein
MYGSIMLGEEAHPILAAEALAALILTFRDHVVLPDDYLEKAKEIYDFQKSHPVVESVPIARGVGIILFYTVSELRAA